MPCSAYRQIQNKRLHCQACEARLLIPEQGCHLRAQAPLLHHAGPEVLHKYI